MMNIVIPMAGHGSRFRDAGFELPKPLILIHKKSLIQCVVENITPQCPHRFIFICLERHLRDYKLAETLNGYAPGCAVVSVSGVTQGAACTVLLAERYIDNDDALMIANSDQYADIDINRYINAIGDCDGLIMTMKASHPKWSYIQHDGRGTVTLLREKEVISDEATVGIYNFRFGRDFVKFAKQMIGKDIRVNSEFYVAPVYNEMIEADKRVTYYNIGGIAEGMYGLGTPEDLYAFRKLELSKRF
jgi:NDP-sugar pyrophosphorylase family protein